MRLPQEFHRGIQEEVEKMGRPRLAQASADLTQQYQAANFASRPIRSEAHRAAYLLVRLPATFAANVRVFLEIQRLAPEASIGSFLDLGAGPGTALHAATQVFGSLRQATMIEDDASLLEQGRRIGSQSDHEIVRDARWIRHDLRGPLPAEPHDLVVASYTLRELSQSDAERVVRPASA